MTNVVKLPAPGRRPASTHPRGLVGKAARSEWDRLAPGLRERGMLTIETEALLVAYCGSLALIAEIDRELSRRGTRLTIKGANGVPRPHPLIGARNKAAQNALQLAKRFGILGSGTAPSTKPTGDGDADPFTELGIC